MEETLPIGKVAELLNVSAATIRFWEDEGLFSVSKGKNHYRIYSPRDLVGIADVMFLRNSGVPVKRISSLRRSSLAQYQEGLEQLESQLAEQLSHCRQMYERTRKQQARAREVLRLQDQAFQQEEVPFEKIALFDYREKEKLLQYSSDPTLYVRYFDTRDMSSEARCIIVPPDAGDSAPHWEKVPGRIFLSFLIRELVEQDYQSDVLDSLALLQRQHRTGILLAQYLFTAVEDGKLTDFLKGYIEIFP